MNTTSGQNKSSTAKKFDKNLIRSMKSTEELATHIRLVHFSLVAAMLGLIASVFLNPTGDLRLALNQVEDIISLQRQLKNDPKWIAGYVESLYEKTEIVTPEWLKDGLRADLSGLGGLKMGKRSSSGRVTIDLSGQEGEKVKGEKIQILLNGPTWRVAAYGGREKKLTEKTITDLDVFNTLSDFRSLWNRLVGEAHLLYLTDIPPTTLFIKTLHLKSLQETMVHVKEFPLIELEGFARVVAGELHEASGATIDSQIAGDASYKSKNFSPDWNRLTIALPSFAVNNADIQGLIPVDPTSYASRSLDFQDVLINRLNARWPKGFFTDSFGELEQVSKDYQDLELDRVKSIIESELRRSGDSFEVLGAKFAGPTLRKWGGMVLLGIQLYLLLHLRILVQRLKRSSEILFVPWIGVYKDTLSQITFAGTAVIAPVLISAGLTAGILRHSPTNGDYIHGFLSIIFCIGLSIWLAIEILKLREVLPDNH